MSRTPRLSASTKKISNSVTRVTQVIFASSVRRVMSIIFCVGIFASLTFAQSFQGGLRGAVKDKDGNILAGATLTLTNMETNLTRTITSNDAGEYVFEKVDPGKYKMTAYLNGFKKLDRTDVLVETQQQITLDFALEVGAVVETVTITGDVPLMETSSASTGTVLSKQILADLPNSGRNPFIMSAITPNVIPVGNPTFNRQQDQSGSSAISLAGGPVRANNYIIDGVPITDLQNRAVIVPSIEAVQEVKVQVNTYDAEAGRTGGGFFNTSAKSGSNNLHGSLFGFLRPTELQANNFFNNRRGIAKPNTPYKLYGGSFGTAVRIPFLYNGKDRTFFWTAFEGYRMSSFLSETMTVPTDLERAGNFSATKDSTGKLITIKDPLTGLAFPGNIIPTSRLDPVGLNLAKYFPKATGSGDALSGLNNYTATGILNDRADQQTMKLDHAVTENYKISAFYAHYGSREPVADFYNNIANPGGSLLFRNVHTLALNNVITLNTSTLLSLRYGYNTFTDSPTTSSAGFDVASLGFANSFIKDIVFKKFPRINIVGAAYGSSTQAALGSDAPSDRRYYSHNILGGLSKLIGKHSLKFGGDWRRMSSDFTQVGQASGEFTFSKGTVGNELASMLLGIVDLTRTNNAQIAKPLATYLNYSGIYAHDDFRVTNKLTLNLGLRYEYEQGLQEKNNQLTVGFDRTATSPLVVPGYNLKGGLIYAGVNGNATQQVLPNNKKFGPRFGFAYMFNDKTTVRGGYGIFWAPPVFAFSITGLGAIGFSSITTVSPGATLSNPFPNGLNQPVGNTLGLLTNVGDTVHFVDPNRKAAYVQQYSLDIQRELPGGITTTLSYVGSRGNHLQIGGINDAVYNINQITPDVLSKYAPADLTKSVANPFYGIIKGGIGNSTTVQQRQLLRPFPQFGDIFMHGMSGAKSSYNSVTLKAQKRLSHGASFLTSYTFSKMLDNIIGQSNFYSGASNFATNIYNLGPEYGLAAIDTPHRFLVSGSYELPFGKGKKLLGNGGWSDYIVGGWQLNAIGTFQSGFPLTVTQSSNNTLAFSGGQRPTYVAGQAIATTGSISDRIDNFLNAAAFTTTPDGTFSTLSRTLGVRSPGQKNWDFGLLKNTKIFESLQAQFRIEAINAFNTPVFRAPNTTFGSSSFGKITSQANFARVIQLSVRLFW